MRLGIGGRLEGTLSHERQGFAGAAVREPLSHEQRAGEGET